MHYPNKKILIAFIIVIVYAIALNEWNIQSIRKINPSGEILNARLLVYNSAIYSVDNEWYLPQIKNFIAGNGFTSNVIREHYDVRRTPVYPIFYGFHYLIFGEKNSFYFIRFTQILIFALATLALYFATFNFTKNKKIAILAASIFGFNPTLVSYLYFTITEALSPALVCFVLYFLSKSFVKNNKKNWFLTGLFFAIASLCRPAIFFFVPALFFAIIYINRSTFKRILLSGFIVALGVITLFLPHVIRNYIVTNGDIVILEKYYGDPMDLGIPNVELRNWISCWMNPADYSSEVICNTIKNAIAFDSSSTKEKVVAQLLQQLPEKATMENKKEDIAIAYGSLYDYYFAINKEAGKDELSTLEKQSISKLQSLKIQFVKNAPWQYYIITPLLIIKTVIFQSNTSTIALLDNYETSIKKKLIKAVLFIFNILLFLSAISSILYIRKYLLLYAISIIFIMVNVLYITYTFRYFEARYLIPIFPCMYLLCSMFIVEFSNTIRKNYTSK